MDARRIWYLSCDASQASPSLNSNYPGENSPRGNSGIEIFHQIQRKRRYLHDLQMLGRDRQNCNLKELGQRAGLPGWEPQEATVLFTSWGAWWRHLLPTPSSSTSYGQLPVVAPSLNPWKSYFWNANFLWLCAFPSLCWRGNPTQSMSYKFQCCFWSNGDTTWRCVWLTWCQRVSMLWVPLSRLVDTAVPLGGLGCP